MRSMFNMNKVLKILFISGIFCINLPLAKAIKTSIFGDVPTYINQQIRIYYYPHHLFEAPALLVSQHIDENGRLDVSFNIEETTQIYLDLESYHVYFLISPGDTFHVELPLYKAKSKAEKYNIFYQPQRFYLSPVSGDQRQLNVSVSRFEMMLENRFNTALSARRSIKGDSIIQSQISVLQKMVEKEQDPYLKQYMHYKTAPFYSLAYPHDPQVQIDSFFIDASPEFNNPSFWEALNSAIKNRDAIGDNIQQETERTLDLLKEKNTDAYIQFIKHHYGIKNNALTALVLLKDMQRLWFTETKSRDDILAFLDILKQNSESFYYVDMATSMYKHLTKTYPGTPAAYFELPDKKGKMIPLQEKNKVLVLNFCSPELQQCARDFISLEKIKSDLGRKVEIINIVIHQEFIDFKAYVQAYQGKNKFVHWNNNTELLDAYQIKGLPAYYIIDTDGTFISSPAPSPDNGLQQTLETIVR